MEPFYEKFNSVYFTINTDFMNNSLAQIKDLFEAEYKSQKQKLSSTNHTPYKLNTTPLINFCKGEFYRILKSSRLPKILIIDQDIADPIFRRIIGVQELKSLEVKLIYFLDNAEIKHINHHYIYLFRSSIKNIQNLTNLFTKGMKDKEWRDHQKDIFADGNLHSIYHIPNLSFVSMKLSFERDLIIHRFNCIQNIALNIFPMAHDLLSMELPSTFRTLITDLEHRTPLWNLAQTIFQLEQVYGIIPNINCQQKSRDSLLVKKYLEEHQDRKEQKKEQILTSTFARLILIDRRDDLITPCLSPMTYEGLIDEIIGINCNIIDIEKENISKDARTNKFWNISEKSSYLAKIPIPLNDEIYSQLKDVNVCALNKIFTSIISKNDQLNKRLKSQDTSPKEIEEIIRTRNKNENLIISHQNIASYLLKTYNNLKFQEYLEAEQNILLKSDERRSLTFINILIKNKEPINQVLRLLSLFQQVYDKADSKHLSKLRQSIIHTYGLRYEIPLVNLERAGMLKSADFANNCKKYKLIDDSVRIDEIEHTSIAYTYGRYAPLSCRQIESLLFEPLKKPSEGLELVCFVGGCTRAEVSACRLLSKKIVVLTTGLINGNTFMKSFS